MLQRDYLIGTCHIQPAVLTWRRFIAVPHLKFLEIYIEISNTITWDSVYMQIYTDTWGLMYFSLTEKTWLQAQSFMAIILWT